MLKKFGQKIEREVTKPFKKKTKPTPAPPPPPSLPSPPLPLPLPPLPLPPPLPSPPPLPLPPPPSPTPQKRPHTPFLFPQTQSTVLPDPSNFFSPKLLSTPLPTNSFFQNYVLKNGDQPEYIHPYLIRSSLSTLSVCYPSCISSSASIYQVFVTDFTISALEKGSPDSHGRHVISSYSDLSVTLDIPSSNLQFFLVRGSPFLTASVTGNTLLSFTTIHDILSLSSNNSLTKYTVQLDNGQTWLICTSSPVKLNHSLSEITSEAFSGIIRIAVLPDSNPRHEAILNQFSTCYPLSGDAVFTKPFCVEYKWEKKGWGDLLMLAHPLQLQLLSNDSDTTVLDGFKYRSIDGELVGVVGDSWVLKTNHVPVMWHSSRGIKEESRDDIVTVLCKDVDTLSSSNMATTSCYFYGKSIARAARLALIAEEVHFLDVIPAIRNFLKETIEPWLDGTFNGNAFLYEGKWGGIITRQGSTDSGADFGFGIYYDHHYSLGYFLYGIAVLAKIDVAWGIKYKPQAYSLMADFLNLGRRADSHYPRLRCFDLYKLHSWAWGLTEFADGPNQESTSEAVNAYYSAALMGMAYGDIQLVAIGSTLTALEIHAAQTWWHVKVGDNMYEEDFGKENKVVSILWANKRDSGLWFSPAQWKECRLGIHVLPLLPVTEVLFSNVSYVKELVEWTLPNLNRKGVAEGWKGFIYALEGIYDKKGALEKIRNLKGFDDGNSLTNLLWWIHSRVDKEEEEFGHEKYSWFGRYYH